MSLSTANPDFSQVKILIVEDDPVMRAFTVSNLTKLGVSALIECADGEEALSSVATHRPDVILSDIHMAPLDGIAFVERLRALRDPMAKKTPVIFMTVDASPTTLRSALSLGISSFIVKPPRINDLQTKIAAALR